MKHELMFLLCCFVSCQDEDEGTEEERNGVLAAVANSCSASDNTNKTDSDKGSKTSINGKKDRNKHGGCSSPMSIMKSIFCIFDCFHVKNPYHIDNYARFSFPLSFIIINVFLISNLNLLSFSLKPLSLVQYLHSLLEESLFSFLVEPP